MDLSKAIHYPITSEPDYSKEEGPTATIHRQAPVDEVDATMNDAVNRMHKWHERKLQSKSPLTLTLFRTRRTQIAESSKAGGALLRPEDQLLPGLNAPLSHRVERIAPNAAAVILP